MRLAVSWALVIDVTVGSAYSRVLVIDNGC
jgi:hypothetical protein